MTEFIPVVPSAQYLDESKLPLPLSDLETHVMKVDGCRAEAERMLTLIRAAEAEGRGREPGEIVVQGSIESVPLEVIKQRFAGKVMDLFLRERYVRLHHQKAGTHP